MDKETQKTNADEARARRLTIIELMTVLAVLGVLLTWVLRRFFLSG